MYEDDDKKGAADRYHSFKEYYVNRRGDAPTANLTMRRWSKGEDQEVLRGILSGKTPEQIAKNIDRTPKAISVRMTRLRSNAPWLPDDSSKRRYTKRRVTYGVIKKRIKEFLAENPSASKGDITEGVQGNQQRIREVANKMIAKGELQYVGGKVTVSNTPQPSSVAQIKEPEQSNDLQYSGGAMFEAHMGKLLLIGGLLAGGVWLALMVMIAALIGVWQ